MGLDIIAGGVVLVALVLAIRVRREDIPALARQFARWLHSEQPSKVDSDQLRTEQESAQGSTAQEPLPYAGTPLQLPSTAADCDGPSDPAVQPPFVPGRDADNRPEL
jgi:hypothetical protein